MRLYKILLFLALVPFVSYAMEYSPADIANPNIADRSRYLADPAHLVSTEATSRVNSILWTLRKETGVEAVMVVVPNTGEYSEEEFATKLFDEWGIGKSDNDNGLLILIVPDQRSARIATGYGIEGVIPDISARKIIERSIVPYMRENNLDRAVVAVAKDISSIISDPVAAAELKSNKGEKWEELPESDITADDLVTFLIYVILAFFLIAMVLYFLDSQRLRKKDRYQQAIEWHKEQGIYLCLAVASAGLGLLPYLLVRRKYNKARNKPYSCPACKGKMHKLNEEEDNNLLSPSQDFEEKLNTVDYDVWVCGDCGTVERYAFPTKQMKYSRCPNCQTVAMCMVSDRVVIPPTTRSTGVGERLYECKYCGHRKNDRYKIPPKTDVGPALAAGAILGSGRGGGGFGGGFGGGRTGGGGATGRW